LLVSWPIPLFRMDDVYTAYWCNYCMATYGDPVKNKIAIVLYTEYSVGPLPRILNRRMQRTRLRWSIMETRDVKKKSRWVLFSGRLRFPHNEGDERRGPHTKETIEQTGAQVRCHADPPPDS
jgi:hypothetical protein